MKILLLTHAYNCLCQRLYVESIQMGHNVSIEFDINDEVCLDAVNRFEPELIIAPFLKRAIPEQIWQNILCWIVHPGIIGDRGPSSLDWAILNQEKTWGVTILQANEVMDGGDIWASASFPMRVSSKSSIYRQEVTSASINAIKQALTNLEDKQFKAKPLSAYPLADNAKWRDVIKQSDRAISWAIDDSETILRKINSADGNPGLLTQLTNTELVNREFYLYNASIDHGLRGNPGSIIATKDKAIAIATIDSAIWVSHLAEKVIHEDISFKKPLKLPATLVLGEACHKLALQCSGSQSYKEVWHHIQTVTESNSQYNIAYLYFNFYNGAMSTEQCNALLKEYNFLAASNVEAIILMGGNDFFSNGIHLNTIESSESPSDASWQNINAMNDICQAIINTTDKLTVAAINGNAGAGGVFLALTCDLVAANDEVVLNPHYKSMGNLFGSEYWTYTLPERVGKEQALEVMNNRLPLNATQAREMSLIDFTFAKEQFLAELINTVKNIINNKEFNSYISTKVNKRLQDEKAKPLSEYREEELKQMKLNFYGFDPSYHVARYHFVNKLPKARTPSYLAKHRRVDYRKD